MRALGNNTGANACYQATDCSVSLARPTLQRLFDGDAENALYIDCDTITPELYDRGLCEYDSGVDSSLTTLALCHSRRCYRMTGCVVGCNTLAIPSRARPGSFSMLCSCMDARYIPSTRLYVVRIIYYGRVGVAS